MAFCAGEMGDERRVMRREDYDDDVLRSRLEKGGIWVVGRAVSDVALC